MPKPPTKSRIPLSGAVSYISVPSTLPSSNSLTNITPYGYTNMISMYIMFLLIGIIITILYFTVFNTQNINISSINNSDASPPTHVHPIDPLHNLYLPPHKSPGWFQKICNSPYQTLTSVAHCNKDHEIRAGVPINIHTRRTGSTEYTQVGILTGNDLAGVPTITVLMGRQSPNSTYKWQYYTIFNNAGNIPVKLPVVSSGKQCSEQYGCDELQTGDSVSVQGYSSDFSVTIYKNSEPSYIPYVL